MTETEPATAMPSFRGAPEPAAVSERIPPLRRASSESDSALIVASEMKALVSLSMTLALMEPAMPAEVFSPLAVIAAAPAADQIAVSPVLDSLSSPSVWIVPVSLM